MSKVYEVNLLRHWLTLFLICKFNFADNFSVVCATKRRSSDDSTDLFEGNGVMSQLLLEVIQRFSVFFRRENYWIMPALSALTTSLSLFSEIVYCLLGSWWLHHDNYNRWSTFLCLGIRQRLSRIFSGLSRRSPSLVRHYCPAMDICDGI